MKIGPFTMTTIVLILLKVVGLLSWSWWLVFLPMAIGFFVWLILTILAIVVMVYLDDRLK